MKYRILNNNPLEFYDSTATLIGTIAANGSNLKISASSGVIELGNTATDIQVGAVGTSINWTFLGGGTIGGNAGTLNIGSAGDTVNMNVASVTYQWPSTLVRYTDLTATNNRINITTQVPGTINFSLPDRPIVPYLAVNNGDVSTSPTTGVLQVTGGMGATGNIYSASYITSANTSSTYQARISEGLGGGPRLELGVISNPSIYMTVGSYNNMNNIENNGRDFRIASTSATNLIYANNSTGYVGLSTASPSYKLHVYTTGRSTDGIRVQSTTGGEIGLSGNVGSGNWNNIVQAGDQVITFHGGAQNTGNLTIVPWSSGPGSGIRLSANGYLAMTTNAIFASGDTTIVGALNVTGSTPFVQPAFNQANNAFNVANAAFGQANNSFNVANAVFTTANSAASFANGAFVTANSAASFANGAFTTANSALANTGTSISANGSSVYTFYNTTASSSTSTGAVVIKGGLGVAGSVYADIFRSLNNGNGTNYYVGDDAIIGDYNTANSMRVSGQQDGTQGYISFGTNAAVNYIGRSGSEPIKVVGPFQVSTNSAVASLTIQGYANKGGVGYHDFLQVTNTYASATNPHKYFRLNSTGGIEVINSAYTATIMSLTDSGSLIVGTTTGDYIQFGDGTRQYTANSASGSSTDTVARNLGQNAFNQANNAFNVANVAYTQANNAASFANGAFVTANSAASFANGAFTLANNTTGVDNTQNTNISSAQSFANSAFTQANNAASFANSAYTLANNTTGVDTTQNTNIASAQSYANSAFTTANNALPKSGGTITGDLAVNGNLSVLGTVTTVNTQVVLIRDNIITLDSTVPVTVPAPVIDSGFEVNRGLYQNTQLVWSEAATAWRMSDGNTFASISSANLTQAAFAQANNAFNVTNVAFGVANSAASFANGAFTSANNLSAVNDTQNTNIASAQSYANGAFDRANSAYNYANTIAASSAQGAFDRANSAYGQANSAASFANGAFTLANNTTGVDNTQNTNISSAQSFANSAFLQANNAASFANGAFTLANNTTGVDNTQNTNISSAQSYSNSAFTQANNAASFANGAFTAANVSQAIDNTQNTNISSAQSYANGAFARANSSYDQANNAASFANSAFTSANNLAAVNTTQNTNIASAQSFANGAFVTANSAASFANGAFTAANNAQATAQGAYNMANNSVITLTSNSQSQITTNNSLGNIVFGLATTGVVAGSYAYYTNWQVDAHGRMTATTASTILEPMGNSAYDFANTGYSKANSAGSFANGAFVTANSAASFANGAFDAANVAYGRIQITANTGDLIANGVNTPVTGNILIGLATTAVAAGTYGGTTQIPVITIDSKGRATYAANVAFSSGSVSITDDNTTSTTQYPLMARATTGTLSTAYTASTDLYFDPSAGTLSAVNFNSTSDANRKTNIRTIDNPLEIITGINGVKFDWIENNLPSAGLIAQDVEKYLPELVTENNNSKALNYNGIIGVLVEAVKQQQKEIEELKQMVQNLNK